jgi:hypothetical protein
MDIFLFFHTLYHEISFLQEPEVFWGLLYFSLMDTYQTFAVLFCFFLQ